MTVKCEYAAADPRQVGGRYWSGYWREGYTVLATTGGSFATLTVRWDDGSVTTHCTAWDARTDRVIAAPGEVRPAACGTCGDDSAGSDGQCVSCRGEWAIRNLPGE